MGGFSRRKRTFPSQISHARVMVEKTGSTDSAATPPITVASLPTPEMCLAIVRRHNVAATFAMGVNNPAPAIACTGLQ